MKASLAEALGRYVCKEVIIECSEIQPDNSQQRRFIPKLGATPLMGYSIQDTVLLLMLDDDWHQLPLKSGYTVEVSPSKKRLTINNGSDGDTYLLICETA